MDFTDCGIKVGLSNVINVPLRWGDINSQEGYKCGNGHIRIICSFLSALLWT